MKVIPSGAAVVGLVVVFALTSCGGSTIEMNGTRAGDLDAGSVISTSFGLRRGQSYMIAQAVVKNVGHHSVVIESVRPQSGSPDLRATVGRIWMSPLRGHLGLPTAWPGWPPKHLPTKPPKWAPTWVQPHPPVLALPTSRTIPSGRSATLVYGITLRSDANSHTRITALRITFKQEGDTYIWTLPSRVRPLTVR